MDYLIEGCLSRDRIFPPEKNEPFHIDILPLRIDLLPFPQKIILEKIRLLPSYGKKSTEIKQ